MSDLSTTECEDHYLINCGTCKDRLKPKKPTVHEQTGFRRGNPNTIAAQFDSMCPRCNTEIIEGMEIVHSDVFDSFVHAGGC